ncbi:hypothetical protein [Streptomyces sp. NPDC057702]|uniref:hypothetical protein n=1 Tax=unclassified Streptomyces TaxID=2593676 RepID=UPI0036B7109E
MVNVSDRVRAVLTGEHEVRTAQGVVLRFFLANGPLAAPGARWMRASDVEFQYAYEVAQFDPRAHAEHTVRRNPGWFQVGLDALVGAGGFFWSDGAGVSGVLTTNGKAPGECGLDLVALHARVRSGLGVWGE